jgi:hypothetical protein
VCVVCNMDKNMLYVWLVILEWLVKLIMLIMPSFYVWMIILSIYLFRMFMN